MFKHLEYSLISRQEQYLYRKLKTITKPSDRYAYIGKTRYLNFTSNDYLGLTSDKKFRSHLDELTKDRNYGSSASRLVSGNLSIINDIEEKLAEMYNYESALLFNSGYQLNIATFKHLFSNKDKVFYDKQSHNSIVNGLKQSEATIRSYRHCDIQSLLKKSKSFEDFYIVTESLFSMSGKSVNDVDLLRASHKFIVDEAHAVGVLGQNGLGLTNKAVIKIGTFGKAYGLFGGFLLCPKVVKDYLINFAEELIYTTALPEKYFYALDSTIEYVHSQDCKREKLASIVDYAKHTLKKYIIKYTGKHQIISIPMDSIRSCNQVYESLYKSNILVLPAKYPTVDYNKAMLRISLTSNHTTEDVNVLIKALKEALK